ncbi:MAG: hypothetical protein ACOX0R_00600 [Candidatus Dojkabacteria bacterium]|jgi:hypothetical protein
MRKKPINTKAMFFLIGLSLFSLWMVNIFSKTDFSKTESQVPVAQPAECTNCQTGEVIEEVIDEDASINYILLDNSQTVTLLDSSDSSVLGISGSDCQGIDPANFLSSKRYVCSTQGSGKIDFTSDGTKSKPGGKGIIVSKDSTIRITKVTYPLALWKGQYTFIDSNKQIRKDSPETRSNGQQIDPEIISRTLSPQEAIGFNESISGTEKKPFVVEGKIKMNLGDVENLNDVKGEYQVEDRSRQPECTVYGKTCDPKLAISDYNVGKSNYIASDEKYGGYLGAQAPGGDAKIISDNSECLVEGKDYKEIDDKDGVVTSCVNVSAMIKGWFTATFGLSQWEECKIGESVERVDPETGETIITTEKSGECVDPKSLGIKMTPIFGEPDNCEKELCANAFLTQSYRETLSPAESGGLKTSGNPKTSVMFFVATKCALEIDGTNVPVLCLWDASPILSNFNLQEKDKAPGQKDFPKNFNAYWNSVARSMKLSAEKYGIN